MENQQKIEDEYKKLNERERVLIRPGTYLGNMHYQSIGYNLYKPSSGKIVYLQNVSYNGAILKLIDEPLSNSVDAFIKRNIKHDITRIEVVANTDGSIEIFDNGGIPVVIHKVEKMYLPRLIFGELGTGSNYNEQRLGAGLNGLGAKLTNIFSKEFIVDTCDGEKRFIGTWKNNMSEFSEKIENSTENGTRIKYKIDLDRFNVNGLDLATLRIIQKRCIDAAASNPGLIVDFKCDYKDGILDSTWQFESFAEYVKLYIENDDIKTMLHFNNKKDEIIIIPRNLGYDFGFVNGAICSQGTHMVKIYNQICKKVLSILSDKNIDLITKTDIFNHMSVFTKTNVLNPDYDSQAKDKLTNRIPSNVLSLTEKFLDQLKDSELIAQLVDYYNVKYVAEQKKKTRKINRDLAKAKTEKFIKCTSRENNELWIFEGDSAKGGFRGARDPLSQAAYLLRGKVLNTLTKEPEAIMLNKEFFNLAAVMKLQYHEPKKNLKNCPFTKIILSVDADTDGNHIAGLMLVFFTTFFPELIKDGRIYRALSPIIVASKNKQEKLYYTLDEYNVDVNKGLLNGWKQEYKKGLGSLEPRHFIDMVQKPKLEQFQWTEDTLSKIKIWFDKSTDMRKEILSAETGYTINDEY